jgi:hypothetical protein
VQHSSLMNKVAGLSLSDSVYNWIADFLSSRQHYTRYLSRTSKAASINAGVVQGSALGPVTFIVCASDLHAVTPGNKTCKYADDVYLIVPASNSNTVPGELANIDTWATANNLRLNPTKSSEIIFKRQRSKVAEPAPTPGLARVSSLKILGVTLQSNMLMTEHINILVSKAAQNMYALKILKSNGLASKLLATVCNATLISRLTYASSAWWGFASMEDRVRIQSVLNKAYRWGFYNTAAPPCFNDLCNHSDCVLFSKIQGMPSHVLHNLLPPPRPICYNLRVRTHNLTLPTNSVQLHHNFLYRMLFKDCY